MPMALSCQRISSGTGTAERVAVAYQVVTSTQDSGRYPALALDAVDHEGTVLLEEIGVVYIEASQADQLLHQLDLFATGDEGATEAVADLAEHLPGLGHDGEGAAGARDRERFAVEGVPLRP